jgi:hypothetical protein
MRKEYMKPMDISKIKLPKTIRCKSVFSIILFVAFIICWFLFINEFFNGSYDFRTCTAIIGIPVLCSWMLFNRIVLSNTNIAHYYGLFQADSLIWKDIESASILREQEKGYFEKKLVLQSRNPLRKDIKINPLYFQRPELFLIIQALISKGSNVKIDEGIIEYFDRWERPYSE